jgi:membrane protein required for colicin V production
MFHLAGLEVSDLRWLDIVGLVLVAFFCVLGLRRGLWWQLVRLLGLTASIAVARAVAPRLSPRLVELFEGLDPRLANGIVWTIVLAIGLILVALIGRIGKETLAVVALGWLDRIGGALAGALTGLLVHTALVVVLCQTSAREWSLQAVNGTHSQQLVDTMARRIPLFLDAHAAEVISPWLERTH